MSKHCKPLQVKNGGIQVGAATAIDVDSLRRAAEAEKPEVFAAKIDALTRGVDPVDGTKLRNGQALTFDNMHLIEGGVRSLQDALEGVKVPTTLAGRSSVMSSAFPALLGGMSMVRLNEQFQTFPSVGDLLVTDVDDVQATLTVVGVLDEGSKDIDEVPENTEYPQLGSGAEKFHVYNRRNGRQIAITQDLIDRNQVAGIVQRIDQLALIARELIEKQTLMRVFDVHGSQASGAEPYVLHRNNAAAALYSTTAIDATRVPSGTQINTNPLTDTASLETARKRLAMFSNERGIPALGAVSSLDLVVPDALASTAAKLLGSELEPGVVNELNNWGPRGRYRPRLVTSPYLDKFVGTQTWALGAFADQFIRHWALRPEFVFRSGNGTDAFLRTREGYRARVGWDCEIGARCFEKVVRCLPATTAPTPSTPV